MIDDVAARRTYRYVRLGMIGAVVLIGMAVLIEHQDAPGGCWQTSISAYYYTPARAIFVGALMAIGLSLIVIKGSTWQEDLCLNAAGMLAPIVALVPTSDVGTCWSIEPEPLPMTETPSGEKVPAEWVVANIDNNVGALLWAGLFGLITAVVIAIVAMVVGRARGEEPSARRTWRVNRPTVLGLVLTGVALGGGAWLFENWDDFDTRAHGFAALAMFGFLALAAVANGWDSRKHRGRWYPWLYFGVAALMAASALLMFKGDWAHKVLWVEILEITWFVVLWIVQSRELWHNTLRGSSAETATR